MMTTEQVITVKFDLTNVRCAMDEVNAALSHYKVLCDNLAEQRNTVKKDRDEFMCLYTKCKAEREMAERTLTSLGYTYQGGEQWSPPLGPNASPLLQRIDYLASRIYKAISLIDDVADEDGMSRSVVEQLWGILKGKDGE
jgi:hypothetical protein